MKMKTILLAGLVLIAGAAIWNFGASSCRGQKYADGTNDQAIITAAKWVQAIEENKLDAARALTGEDADAVIGTYRKELEEIGKVADRELFQRNFLPTAKGNINQVVFNISLQGKKWRLSERIFLAEDKDKKWKIIGSRFLVPLPPLQNDGQVFMPDMSDPGNPQTLATQWFSNFDDGKTSLCSKYRAAGDAFRNGMFFFNEGSLPANARIEKWLTELRKAGKPLKRNPNGRMLWRGFPGMGNVDIVKISYIAEYLSGTRTETLWLFKDNFFPNRGWYIYHVAFGKMEKNKKNDKPIKKQ